MKLAAPLGAILLLAAVVLGVVDLAQGLSTPDVVTDLTLLPVVIFARGVGPVILRRQPGNAIGRLFCADLLLTGTIMLADTYAATAARGCEPPAVRRVRGVGLRVHLGADRRHAARRPADPLSDGSPTSPRWRLAERLVWGQIAILTIGLAFAPTTIQNYVVENPVTPPPSSLFTVLMWIGYILIVPCIALGALAVAFRYRRARRNRTASELERLVFGAGVAAFAFTIAFFFTISGTDRAWSYVVPVALTCVVLSAGIAVLRCRLYDVDRLINRTVSYGVLSIVLAATYVGLVLAGQALFSAFAGGSDLAVAASTLVVAGLFLPLRTRVQRFVDRRFYRRRYDTRRTLESFGARLRREVDLTMLSAELTSVVDQTMQPTHVSLWIRKAPE